MTVQTHLAELSEKHRVLEKKIAEEMSRPSADTRKLSVWKLEKLKLKDEIAKLESRTRH